MPTFPPYAVEQATPGFTDWLQQFSAESRRVSAARRCTLDVAFGDTPAERMDVFPAEQPGGPVVVFLHGGGWRASSKADRLFPAEVFGPAGAAWVSLEYPLAPAATLDDMTACVRKGLAWVARHAQDFGADPNRLYVCGNSAGGHLAAVLLTTDWTRHGLPADLIMGGTFISGVFDMVPILHSGANAWLKMDIDAAVRHSPIYRVPAQGCPIVCAVGADELPEFIEQSRTFAAVWRSHGHPGTFLPCEGLHHFSIIGELARADSALTRAMRAMMGLQAR